MEPRGSKNNLFMADRTKFPVNYFLSGTLFTFFNITKLFVISKWNLDVPKNKQIIFQII